MNNLLPAIGFSSIKNRQMLEPVYREVLHAPTKKIISTISADTRLVQFNKSFGDGFGLSLVGEMAIDGSVSIEYYFPFVRSKLLTVRDGISIERHSDKRSYAGITNGINLGMTLIFNISNIADYEQSMWLNRPNTNTSRVFFSGLSTSGSIILDLDKSMDMQPEYSNVKRNKLIEAAKRGDPDAIECLTLEDMDTYNLIGKRSRHEDILSIVESSFMPIGIDTDQYSIIGSIISFTQSKNTYSGEEICLLDVKCNDLTLTVAINKKHLVGEPAVGRRFKGDIWLQGHILFS